MEGSKKRKFRHLVKGVVYATAIFFLTGCVSKQIGVYGSSTTAEQCTLVINGTLKVTSFDGNKVKWSAGFFGQGQGASKITVQIPAGTHEFVVDYKQQYGSGYFEKKNIKVSFDFEAGKTYKMESQRISQQAYVHISTL